MAPAANELLVAPPALPELWLDIAPDAMLCLNQSGFICAVNDRAATMFGCHSKLMTGAHLGAFIADDQAAPEASSPRLLEHVLAGDGKPLEATAHTMAGQHLAVEITSMRHDQAGAIFTVCALRDITHRKHSETVLTEAKEIAERANVAKLEFLSQLSHELRTPLAAIIGFGEVMRDEMFGPLGVKLYQSYAADICKSGQQLTDAVERIIDVTRLEGRMAMAHARQADLGEIIERVMENAAAAASHQGIRVTNNVRRGSLPVMLDDETLEKMIGHVIDNAIAFNRFGGKVEVSVATDQKKDANQFELVIADTGIGMTPDKLGTLRRSLDSAGTDSGGGLSLCSAFLHLIGGRLDVASAHNLGTTVTMTLPRRHDGI
ncbi:MAG: PAS domain S-box protein [Rhodospirillaceae bacterium]|nr:PAS domain S-box protein [Rhodospirillaceae bacterium]